MKTTYRHTFSLSMLRVNSPYFIDGSTIQKHTHTHTKKGNFQKVVAQPLSDSSTQFLIMLFKLSQICFILRLIYYVLYVKTYVRWVPDLSLNMYINTNVTESYEC
jgi:hypothetical protein